MRLLKQSLTLLSTMRTRVVAERSEAESPLCDRSGAVPWWNHNQPGSGSGDSGPGEARVAGAGI